MHGKNMETIGMKAGNRFGHVALSLLLGWMLLAGSGCKKCTTCQVTAQGSTTSEEKCGDKDDVKQFEDDCKASAALLRSIDPDAKCTCTGS